MVVSALPEFSHSPRSSPICLLNLTACHLHNANALHISMLKNVCGWIAREVRGIAVQTTNLANPSGAATEPTPIKFVGPALGLPPEPWCGVVSVDLEPVFAPCFGTLQANEENAMRLVRHGVFQPSHTCLCVSYSHKAVSRSDERRHVFRLRGFIPAPRRVCLFGRSPSIQRASAVIMPTRRFMCDRLMTRLTIKLFNAMARTSLSTWWDPPGKKKKRPKTPAFDVAPGNG